MRMVAGACLGIALYYLGMRAGFDFALWGLRRRMEQRNLAGLYENLMRELR